MIIDCVSDLHGHYPKLEGGDLLIVAGDLTARSNPVEYGQFAAWMDRQKYKKKILVAGNHDNLFERAGFESIKDGYSDIGVDYLCDSGTEFEALKIWGSPWTKTFEGMNPYCKAFTCDTEEELAEKYALIPEDTDILITHGPVYGVLDQVKVWPAVFNMCYPPKQRYESAGSKSLLKHLNWDGGLRLHVFGHIHEGYGEEKGQNGIFSWHHVNASHVNERYQPVNEPIRVIL